MSIEFTIDEAWRIYEMVKEEVLYLEKVLAIIPEDGKVSVKQAIDRLSPITSKLEIAFPKFLEAVAQNELGRRAEERMQQEGFR